MTCLEHFFMGRKHANYINMGMFGVALDVMEATGYATYLCKHPMELTAVSYVNALHMCTVPYIFCSPVLILFL